MSNGNIPYNFVDQFGDFVNHYEDALRNGFGDPSDDAFNDELYIAVGEQAGSEWARTRANACELARAAWFNAAVIIETDRLLPEQFVFAINPRVAIVDWAGHWRSMLDGLQSPQRVGYDPESADGVNLFECGFFLGATCAAGQYMLIDEYPPRGDCTAGLGDLTFGPLGTQRGREWASTRASDEELQHLTAADRLFYAEALDQIVFSGRERALAALFVFLVTPPPIDFVPYYPAVWLDMVGRDVAKPWGNGFVRGFVSAALEVTREQMPEGRTAHAGDEGPQAGAENRQPRGIRLRWG